MRHVAVSISEDRMRKLRRAWPEIEVFPGVEGCGPTDYRTLCIPPTYHNLALWGKEQGLGKETIVRQDDVWLPHGPGFEGYVFSFTEPLVVFGQTEKTGIVIPKAFSADPFIWEVLPDYWTGEGRIGPAWMPLVEEYGIVLDVTRQL